MPAAQAKAIDEANAKAKQNVNSSNANGLPQWALDLLQNADKIGKGIGAATGKGGASSPPVVITTPTASTDTPIPQWVWYVAGGVVLIVVFALISRNK